MDYGLIYEPNDKAMCGYSDADWAGNCDDRKSTTDYVFKMSGAAISWRSKKQSCVALSNAEAEYIALANTAQEAAWLKRLVNEICKKLVETIVLYEDNQSAIHIAKNPQFHGRIKHIDIKYHYIRDQISRGNIELIYCQSNDMVADMLTKELSKLQFEKLRYKAGVKSVSDCE